MSENKKANIEAFQCVTSVSEILPVIIAYLFHIPK